MFIKVQAARSADVRITFEGRAMRVGAGQSVAAALLEAGVESFRRTAVSGADRGPYCMIGACFDCLVAINDMPNRQACLVQVRDGMEIMRQDGAGELSLNGCGP